MVVMVVEVWAVHTFIELTSWHWGSGKASIHTSLVECQRVLRYEHTDVREDRGIIFRVAVAVRRDVQYQRDVEMWTSVDNRLGVFGHFIVQKLWSMVVSRVDGIEVAGSNASATA